MDTNGHGLFKLDEIWDLIDKSIQPLSSCDLNYFWISSCPSIIQTGITRPWSYAISSLSLQVRFGPSLLLRSLLFDQIIYTYWSFVFFARLFRASLCPFVCPCPTVYVRVRCNYVTDLNTPVNILFNNNRNDGMLMLTANS